MISQPLDISRSNTTIKTIMTYLNENGIKVINLGGLRVLNDELYDQAQSLLDGLFNVLPDLIPVQFHFLLNKYGFNEAISLLLPALKVEDINKYAMYKAYLEQARFYEFEKTLVMFNDIKAKFITVDESLDFTLEQLKSMWLEASQV